MELYSTSLQALDFVYLMAMVQYRDEINGVDITRRMFPPKKVERLEHWYKAARKVITEIPDIQLSGMEVINTQCTIDWITWEVKDSRGFRSYVVINRRANSFA